MQRNSAHEGVPRTMFRDNLKKGEDKIISSLGLYLKLVRN